MVKIYKVLSKDGHSCHGGEHEWSLPRGKRPGKWTDKIDPVPCSQGWHACRGGAQLLEWMGETVWECEVRGKVIDCGDKIVAEQMRIVRPTAWGDLSARLFAADCAARVAHLSGEPRVYAAIDTARAFALGNASLYELSAAWDAARAASSAAAWAAARAASWDAARAASSAAAWAAARAASSAASWDAARAASWDAARAASSAASWDAARAASWDAAKKWQARRLLRYVHGRRCKPIKYKVSK